jgi:hypothetical protein
MGRVGFIKKENPMVKSEISGRHELCLHDPTPGYERIKKTALAYVDKMKIGDAPGQYAKEEGEGESLYGSYHGFHILDLFGEAPTDRAVLKQWAEQYKKHQTKWGHFAHDPENDRQRSPEEMDPLWHYTRGNTWSLYLLGEKPDYPYNFLEPFFDKGYMYNYIKRYNWKNSWAAGNQICAVATAMMGARDFFGESRVDEILEKEMYPALEELQDPKTGYWGTQLGADIWNGQFGTIHVLPMYFAQGWPVRYLNESVDTTFETQLKDGSFWAGGSDCPDFDGAYMLLNLARMTDYKSDEIRKAARLYLDHALMHEDEKGVGFRLHRRGSKYAEWKPRPHWIWKEGESEVSAEHRDDDINRTHIMLGSWFYPLSIALVSMILGDSGYEGPYRLNRKSLHQCNFMS